MNLHAQTRIAALDSSPLLLLLAGRTDPSIIPRFKHLSMFEVEDYALLTRLISRFHLLITTPHVLTEVSNHAHHLKGSLGLSLLRTYAKFAHETHEFFRESKMLSQQPEFQRFGMTDCALSELDKDVTIITEDFRLAGHLTSKGKPVINFNTVRQARLVR